VVAKMFWVSLVAKFQILIPSSTQEHFRLAKGVSEDVANIVFNKAACKVIKDAIKHAHLVSISVFYM
jgi:hypothetical protein